MGSDTFIYSYNHYHSQDIEYFDQPSELSVCPFPVDSSQPQHQVTSDILSVNVDQIDFF